MIRNSTPAVPARHYTLLAVQPDSFDPFKPDALGALREAYAWIANPALMGNGEVIYCTAHYNALTAMMRRVLDAQVPT